MMVEYIQVIGPWLATLRDIILIIFLIKIILILRDET